MKIQWDNSLNTRNSVVDSQHQELCRMVGRLVEACREDAAKEAVQETIRFIEVYMNEHFTTEENLMAESGFPDIEAHRAEHREFCGQVDRIKKLFEIHGADYSLAIDTINTIFGWVGLHIYGRDKAFCRYIQEQGAIKQQPYGIIHPLNLSE
jgi:hemerythrin-like metal-binding protein